MRMIIKKWIIPLLGILFLSAFPIVFLYCNNAGEVNISETIEPLALFCAIGLGVFLVSGLITRSSGKSALISGLFMLAFSNFSLMESGIKLIFPNFRYWHTLPIVFVIWLEIALLIGAFLPEDMGKVAGNVLCLVFGGLTLVNIIIGIPSLVGKIQAEQKLEAAKQQKMEIASSSAEQPNIYLLIFDEYAGFRQMEEYYNYDNAVLKNFLEDNHFTISYDSHNESIMTATVITNLMNLDYVVDNTFSTAERELIRKEGKLFEEMQKHGYTTQIIEVGNFLGDESPIGSIDIPSAHTASGEDFSYLVYKKTPIYPFNYLNNTTAFAAIMNVANYLSSENIFQQYPTFTLGYLIFPHQPFIVDENGNAIPPEQYDNWKDDRYYLGQFKYATKIMMNALQNILDNDPGAIIILQSDHGARASTDEDFMEKFPLNVMNTPLNAVYYQGESIDEIRGLSSVNTLRSVLSRLWNEQYDLIDVPEDTFKYK